MSSHSHIETAQAMSDVSLISVQREQYGLLIEKNAPVAMKIIEQFSRRMRYLDEALGHLTNKASTEGDPDHLFNLAEYYAKQNQYNLAYYAYYHYSKSQPKAANMQKAMERMAKIQPYAKVVFLDGSDTTFNRLYPKNTMIFAESMPGKELYIIQKGSVKISKLVGGTEVLLAILKVGDIFGEMSLIENKPRSASAVAYEDATLMAVNKVNFARMVSSQPQIIARLTQLLSERIWFIYKQLANTLQSDPLGKMYDALLIQLEKARVGIRNGESYTFDFGPKELINMVGLPLAEGNKALRELLQNPKIKTSENRIVSTNVIEILNQATYYRKLQKLEKHRRDQGR
jgi:CRP-like cAMP-binding protein